MAATAAEGERDRRVLLAIVHVDVAQERLDVGGPHQDLKHRQRSAPRGASLG